MGRPKGSVQVPDERRSAILDLHNIGVRQCDNSTYYGMPQSTVCNITRGGRQPLRIEKRGRKQLPTPRATRSLLEVADELTFESTDTIAKELNEFSPVPVNSRTVRRCLLRNKIRNYVAVSKPHLSSTNMLKRIEWTSYHKNWTDKQWTRLHSKTNLHLQFV